MPSNLACVLVVEDEAAQREVLAYNLQAEGFDVAGAENGDDALLLVDEAPPDVIILDWMLPGVSGIEICRGALVRRRWACGCNSRTSCLIPRRTRSRATKGRSSSAQPSSACWQRSWTSRDGSGRRSNCSTGSGAGTSTWTRVRSMSTSADSARRCASMEGAIRFAPCAARAMPWADPKGA